MSKQQEFYRIPRPWCEGEIIVYGDGSMGWYNYRIVDATGWPEHVCEDRYGIPEIALRDALNRDTGIMLTV
jgi:hypothetical protein